MTKKWHFNVHDKTDGILRHLTEGVSARIYGGEQMTVSVVEIDPGASSPLHSHPQEQWGFMVEGDAVRILGNAEVSMKKGDFWHTPGNVPHGMVAGPNGAVVIDVFAPPRKEYMEAGSGFGSGGPDDSE